MNINATLFGQMFMFALFTWFCMKFVWPPIVAAMEERKKRIESGLIAAERGLSEHKEAQQKAQELLRFLLNFPVCLRFDALCFLRGDTLSIFNDA
jgi:F-type H+-transporting ATPase subunit b